MRLTAFRSGQGDCLLLEGESSGRILVDGGMRDPYRAHVAPALAKLRAAGKKLDLIYISHIDRDHIGGILELLNVEMSWRVYEHQIANDNPRPSGAAFRTSAEGREDLAQRVSRTTRRGSRRHRRHVGGDGVGAERVARSRVVAGGRQAGGARHAASRRPSWCRAGSAPSSWPSRSIRTPAASS